MLGDEGVGFMDHLSRVVHSQVAVVFLRVSVVHPRRRKHVLSCRCTCLWCIPQHDDGGLLRANGEKGGGHVWRGIGTPVVRRAFQHACLPCAVSSRGLGKYLVQPRRLYEEAGNAGCWQQRWGQYRNSNGSSNSRSNSCFDLTPAFGE